MRSKVFWPHWKVRALRARFSVERDGDGERAPMNQEEFGRLLGGYIQPTVSGWENKGCTSRRGCHDLQRLAAANNIDHTTLEEVVATAAHA